MPNTINRMRPDESVPDAPDKQAWQPATPPEDQPLNICEDRARNRRPAWAALATPASIVLASIIIAAPIWVTRDDDDAPPAAPDPSPAGELSSAATSPLSEATPGGQPSTILAALVGYAREIGIDQSRFQQCLFDAPRARVISDQLQRGIALGITGTPTFFINNKKVVGAQPTAIFDPPRFEIVSAPPDLSDAAFEGRRDAKVIVAEFSDFQCPFCKRWTEQTLKALRAKKSPDVALAFLHFPILQIHPNAGNASLAAVCAGDQGKFWQMHDLLFERQAEWGPLRSN
jgi:predicted DsbA family dithiol-disulfide isomerase